MTPDLKTPREIAAYYHQNASPMRDVMVAAYEAIRSSAASDKRQLCLRESFLRAAAWIKSVAKLHEPADVQAINAGCRALSEIATDMALLHHDKTQHSAELLLAYERSALLVSANRYAAFVGRHRLSITEDHAYAPLIQFKERHETAIKEQRMTLWGSGDHPKTWTGRAGLLQNAQFADGEAACECWKRAAGPYLEEMYAERNAHLNWLTHGSGGAGLRGIDDLDPLNALTLRDALWLADICLHVASHEFPTAFDTSKVTRLLQRLSDHLKKPPQ